MTRKELEKYFRHPRYIGMEDYIRKVMKDRPDIDNEDDIEYAAAIMQECDGDGVELSTENALRLTKIRDEEMTREEFNAKLVALGLNDAEKAVELLKKIDEDFEKSRPETLMMTTVARAAEMTRLAAKLEDGNKDIVVMGIPADLSWSTAMLKMAFFTDELTEDEQKTIYDIRLLSDKVKFYEKNGIGYAIFRINVE